MAEVVVSPSVVAGGAQDLVKHGYRKQTEAYAIVLGVTEPEPAKAWLRTILGSIAFRDAPHDGADQVVQVAFTAPGLAAFGRGDWLDSLSDQFRDGMTAEHRSRVLGDTGESTPAKWSWGPTDVHVLLLVYWRPGSPAREVEKLLGLREIARVRLGWDPPQGELVREQFGFVDGIGQPRFEGLAETPRPGDRRVALGELLLGHRDERERLFNRPVGPEFPLPKYAELLEDGTYLVARQLEQDVFAFWKSLRAMSEDPDVRIALAYRIIGRDREGRPLAAPDAEDFDVFSYGKDTDGIGCPFGAHIRRTNPRDWMPKSTAEDALTLTQRHRILRRGRIYGDVVPTPNGSRLEHALTCSKAELAQLEAVQGAKKRGLFFIGLCADIARQFEFLHQNWVHGSIRAGRGAEPDPLIGSLRLPGPRYFAVSGRGISTRHPLPPSAPITVRGGGYFFLPSRKALEALCGKES